jgi:DnaK suppressor protein
MAKKPAPKSKAKTKPVKSAKPAKAAAKPVKVAPKKAPPAKPAKPAPKAVKPKVEAKAAPAVEAPKAAARKGITIVTPKPVKKPVPVKPPTQSFIPASAGRLLDGKTPFRKPLIPSGPKAAHIRPLGSHAPEAPDVEPPKAKSPFGKRELEKYRQILLKKRFELVGDVNTMENEALRGQSGSLSNMPQHLAEQGSEAYDQSLSLDLAAADRKLIREIDDALARIEAGTFGCCEISHKPISVERLEELPWARYSIETARELERQSLRSS